MNEQEIKLESKKSSDLMESNQKMIDFARQELQQGNML